MPTDTMTVMRNVLLLDVSSRDNALDPVIWSLAIEVRFSIIFMMLAILATRRKLALILLTIACHAAARLILQQQGMSLPYLNGGGSLLGSLAVTAYYLPAFGIGIAAADLSVAARAPPRLPAWAQLTLFVGLLLAGKLINDDFAWCLVSTGLVAIACQRGPIAWFLSLPPCGFLGAVSYSLYLIHFPILMATVYALSSRIGLVPSIVLAPMASIGLATLMHRFIELPGIDLGRRAAAALATHAALSER
jgi:peptidoglycan/LPS O-acetylase OafA/YrhL